MIQLIGIMLCLGEACTTLKPKPDAAEAYHTSVSACVAYASKTIAWMEDHNNIAFTSVRALLVGLATGVST